MEGTPAIVLTHEALDRLLEEAGCRAAEKTVAKLQSQLIQDPRERHLRQLRGYLMDRSTLQNPRELWANGHHIRRIELSSKGKPKSMTWFQRFKHESGLAACISRPSAEHGRLQEWTFEDIANAWDRYYALQW
ncbi:hypothetical protein [Rhodobium gokarnense]|uniref:Transposase n=1 Tax=Rhodobium gokarnense TaxID=364296 RepID=A0ABT3HAD2_9HYPH|nr:hypothetical protein [Rhodobium gokarnense]MCW2307360.1 hypothetical protein [Rhodobium gokarnense]